MAIVLNTWERILTSAPWAARRLHRTIYVNGYIYLCGGYNLSNKYNDVWRSSNGVTWELLVEHAEWSPRSAHGFIYYDNKFWVFGGSGVLTNQFYNDVWYSTDAITWTQATAAAGWSIRHEFSFITFDNKLWLIGGYNGTTYLSDVWSSTNGSSWTNTAANLGIGIREHVSANFLGKMWVFGGEALSGYSHVIYSSTNGVSWTFDGYAAWPARREHEIISIADENRLSIIGGYNGADLNDVWESTNGTVWTEIPQASPFPVRGDFGFADDGRRAYIFGGLGVGESVYYNDVWMGKIYVDADFSATPLSGPTDLTVNFSNLSTGSPDSFDWDFGDGSPHSYVENPTHVYTTLGSFTVTLLVHKNTETFTATKPNYITTSSLIPNFTSNVTSGPVDLIVNFTNTTIGSVDVFDWDFGDGSPHSSEENPSHTYGIPGSYPVTLVVHRGIYTRTELKPNYVTATLVPDFTSNVTSCPINTVVNFINTTVGSVDVFDWDFGDGSPHSSEENPSHVYTIPDLYTVTLTVHKGVYTASEPKPDYITVNITADFTATPLSTSAGVNVDFTDTTDYLPDTWSWDFGDGSPSLDVQNPSHIYLMSGIYTVSLVVSKNSVSDTETKIQYIRVRVSEDFMAIPRTSYIDTPIQFLDLSVGGSTSWDWDFGDGSPHSTEKNPLHSYTHVGMYSVTLTVDEGSVTKEDYIEILVEENGTGFVRGQGPSLIFG